MDHPLMCVNHGPGNNRRAEGLACQVADAHRGWPSYIPLGVSLGVIMFRRRSVMNSRRFRPSAARVEPGTIRRRRAAPRSAPLLACALAATLAMFGSTGPGIGQPAKVEAGKGKTDVIKEAKVEP